MNRPFNDGEILLIYGAKLCNPNGDPDDENRPRIDRRTNTNLVTDVRLKRFFRNYIVDRYGEEFIWVSTVGGEHVRAEKRLERMDEKHNPETVLKNCIDARLFGATIPIGKGNETKGKSYAYTGPVQFTWGYSLHPVELVESPSITSVFQGREVDEGAESYGTIGKDWRLYYSLIAFYGAVNGTRAGKTSARELDLIILDNLLWEGLAKDATTRSKIGHQPHLYIRIAYSGETMLGDLRRYVKSNSSGEAKIRDFWDVVLDFSPLVERLEKATTSIEKVYIYESDDCASKYNLAGKLTDSLKDKVAKLPHDLKVEREMLTVK